MATFQSTYGNADWYKKMLHPDLAQSQADKLGISTDQLFKLYADTNTQRRQQGQSGMIDPRWTGRQGISPTGGFQGWSGGQGGGTTEQLIAAPAGGNAIVGMYGPMATWQKIAGPQPQQVAPQQPQMPQLAPPQARPTVPITPLTPTPQLPVSPGPAMNVPQASAPMAAPLFSLGQSQLPQAQLPQAQNPLIQPPQQQFQYGGLVRPPDEQQPIQRFQSGGWVVDPSNPAIARQGRNVTYGGNLDPAWAQYGLGNMTLAQAKQLNPTDVSQAQAAYGPQQVGAEYEPYFLGAAALNMPAVINLPPSGTPSKKSGVAPTPGAIVGTGVPQVPQGPWTTQPGVFAKAAMPTLSGPGAGWGGGQAGPLTAATPANVAQFPQMNITPAYAQLPPGANVAAAQGPPTDRVPAVLTPGEFVMNRQATAAFGPQLARMNQMAGGQGPPRMMGGQGAPPAPGPAAQGAAVALGTTAAQAPAMSPFMQGFQHGAAGLNAQPPQPPQKMQGGGFVYPQEEPQLMTQPGDQSAPSSDQGPSPYRGTVQDDPYMSHAVSRSLGMPSNPWHSFNPHERQPTKIPGLPANAEPNVALRLGLNPNAGLPAGTSGYLDANKQPLGPTPGTGSQVTPTQYGIGQAGAAIGQGLQQAAQAIGSSVHPWQWQQDATAGLQQSFQQQAAQKEQQIRLGAQRSV